MIINIDTKFNFDSQCEVNSMAKCTLLAPTHLRNASVDEVYTNQLCTLLTLCPFQLKSLDFTF